MLITALLMLLPALGPMRWAVLPPALWTAQAGLVFTGEGPRLTAPCPFHCSVLPAAVSSSVETLLGPPG